MVFKDVQSSLFKFKIFLKWPVDMGITLGSLEIRMQLVHLNSIHTFKELPLYNIPKNHVKLHHVEGRLLCILKLTILSHYFSATREQNLALESSSELSIFSRNIPEMTHKPISPKKR
jgi:hypothetical protein